MKRYQNGAIIAGVAALVLSLLVGAIAGVRIGALIVRALLSAAVFAGGAVLVGILIDRFLPELAEEADETEEAPSSGHIDIVVEEQPEPESESVDEGESSRRRPSFEPEIVEEVEEAGAGDAEELMREAETEESGGTIDVGEEPLDELPDIGAFADSFVSSQSEGDTEESDNQEGDAFGSASETPAAGSAHTRQSDSGVAGNDPETIAKAIRTMMGRDE